MNSSTGYRKTEKIENNQNKTDSNSEINNEILTSLRFDNSVLSNELLNLNREFNKVRNENKVLSEKNIKLDKDKKDLIEKLKQKTEQSDKYKKENDEITRMINNTKYKNIINAETENKKLKNILEQNDIEIKKLKNMNEKCAKKILEQNNQIEKMKTALGSLLNFKQQKEKLIIENKNYEIEINRLKNELIEEKNKNEKNEVLIGSKDKEIEKLVNDVKYYSFHIKKYKSDAERALEDAIGYQKIVALLEIQLNQYKEQLDTIKNVKTEE
jgi:DNA repair exonuclease SbcCD ATPase subunit